MIEDPIQVMVLDDETGELVPYAIPKSQVTRVTAMALVDNALYSPSKASKMDTSNFTQEGLDEFRDMLIWRTMDELRKLPS